MLDAVRRLPLVVKGARLPWPRLLALRRETLAVIEGRDLLLVFTGVGREDLRTKHVQVLGWAPSRIHVSATGKHLLLESPRGNYVQVLELETGKRVTEIVGPERVRIALTKTGDDDLVVCSRTPGVLEGLVLPSLSVAFRSDCSKPVPFMFDRLEIMADLDSLAVVGHRWLEPLDALLMFEVSELMADPDLLQSALAAPPEVTGDALFLGAGGGDEVPVLVTTEDELGEDRIVVSSFATGELESGAVTLPRVVDPTPALLLTDDCFALGRGGTLSLMPRPGKPGTPIVIGSRVQGVDRAGPRLVHWPGEGSLELVELGA